MSSTKQNKFDLDIKKVIRNLKKIPDEFFVTAGAYRVVWLISRDRPSAGEQSYSFDMERFGITRDGQLIWGFDSGCSCPSPFEDNDYEAVKTWKDFILKEVPLDPDWREEATKTLTGLLMMINDDVDPKDVLQIENAEVRRYLIKRIGYENIKDAVKAEILHVDGHNELLKFNTGEMYVKVRDSSTEREYLLYVEGRHTTCRSAIAWTFGLTEQEYQPIIET